EGGALRVPTGAGLGVEVDEEKVRHASRGWFSAIGAAGFRASAVFVEGSGWRKGGTQRAGQARADLQLRAAVEAGRAPGPPPMLLYLPGVHSGRGFYAGRFPRGPLASPRAVLVVVGGGDRGQDIRSLD